MTLPLIGCRGREAAPNPESAAPSRNQRGLALLIALAVWGIALLGAFLLAPELHGQGTPAGTRITSLAKVSYQAENGASYTIFADPAEDGAD